MCITFLQGMVKWEEEEQGPGVVEHVSTWLDAPLIEAMLSNLVGHSNLYSFFSDI